VPFILQDLLLAAGPLVFLLLALEAGFRAGWRNRGDPDPHAGAQVGVIQGAMLGLLGLLLAFSFAAAANRFLERQDLIVQEANAIGTAYLRADLLDEPHRSELRSALKRYTELRIETSARLREGASPVSVAEMERLHSQMWAPAVAGVAARPSAILAVLSPINDVIDLHSTRVAASKKHVPPVVMGLLVVCSLLAIGTIGYGCGLGGRRHPALTVPLALLIGTSLWVTIDLDQPRAGLMRLSDEALRAIRFDAQQP
jgi:hypothetical protein